MGNDEALKLAGLDPTSYAVVKNMKILNDHVYSKEDIKLKFHQMKNFFYGSSAENAPLHSSFPSSTTHQNEGLASIASKRTSCPPRITYYNSITSSSAEYKRKKSLSFHKTKKEKTNGNKKVTQAVNRPSQYFRRIFLKKFVEKN